MTDTYKIPTFYETNAAVVPWHIDASGAKNIWNKSKGSGIVVAVIDTGLDLEHPEFTGRIVSPKSFLNYSPDLVDYSGHGTHVAGIIAGTKTGVAPSARIMPLKVGDANGRIDIEAAKDAMRFVLDYNKTVAAKDKVRYVNCSFGGWNMDLEMWIVIKNLLKSGVSVFAAAGNSGDGKPDTWEVNFPGFFPESICIGACDQNYVPAQFTNSYDGVDFMAFGVDIFSTWPGGGYKALSGTSMASPMALGLCLLIEAFLGGELTDEERYTWLKRYLRSVQGDQLIVGDGVVDLSVTPRYEKEILLTLDKKEYTINNEVKIMDIAPQLIDNRTMIPVRFVSEALGTRVEWDGTKNQIKIMK